jgi:hypothetical protein
MSSNFTANGLVRDLHKIQGSQGTGIPYLWLRNRQMFGFVEQLIFVRKNH